MDPDSTNACDVAAVQHGWSRNVLLNKIMNRAVERTGNATSTFARQLAVQSSELAQQLAKIPTTSNSSASPGKSSNVTWKTL